MKKKKNVESYFNLITNINYENENGGAYAYLQFLAYSRELLTLLRPVKKVERQLESIEAINWLFNEYLAVNFTFRHKVIFDEKINEVKNIIKLINVSLKETEIERANEQKVVHAQAA
ncbi:MAG: hypothetical protein Q7W45_06805 [Bacteroidota bacterium]|nr:hypothetical protein [Bacteroidota bacterium]MDP3145158.1 hypothetical protein [Bacteroidota bacterium]MDP3556757.1 hypothetical protein [Bacteroidota bacterium]